MSVQRIRQDSKWPTMQSSKPFPAFLMSFAVFSNFFFQKSTNTVLLRIAFSSFTGTLTPWFQPATATNVRQTNYLRMDYPVQFRCFLRDWGYSSHKTSQQGTALHVQTHQTFLSKYLNVFFLNILGAVPRRVSWNCHGRKIPSESHCSEKGLVEKSLPWNSNLENKLRHVLQWVDTFLMCYSWHEWPFRATCQRVGAKIRCFSSVVWSPGKLLLQSPNYSWTPKSNYSSSLTSLQPASNWISTSMWQKQQVPLIRGGDVWGCFYWDVWKIRIRSLLSYQS